MRLALLCTLLLGISGSAAGQDFEAGWRIVESCAEFNITQGAPGEDVGGQDLSIVAGESVLASDRTADGILVYEAHGRVSVMRPEPCLVPAPAGRPARLIEDVQLLDRTLTVGSVIWVTGLDAGQDVVNVLVNGGERLNLPTRKVEFLRRSYFAQPNARPGWQSVRR